MIKYFKYLDKIKNLDTFGVTYKTRISSQESQQKSLVGGVFSLILYALSLAYFSLIMYQWSNGDILPKISTNQNVLATSTYTSQFTMFQFTFMKTQYGQIDPFDPQNIVLLPVFFAVIDSIPQAGFTAPFDITMMSQFNTTQLTVSNITLAQDSSKDISTNQKNYIMALVKCDPVRLLQDQKCANSNLTEKFWDQGVNLIQYSIFTYQYNTSANRVDMVKRNQVINVNSDYNFFGQYSYMTQNIIKDDGLLFKSQTNITILSQFELVSQTTKIDYLKHLNITTYLTLYQRLSPISFDYQITYPKIGEVLASVSSIVSLLFLIKYAVIFYNEFVLEQRLIYSVFQIQEKTYQGSDFEHFVGNYRKFRAIYSEKEKVQEFNQIKQESLKQLELLEIIRQIHCIKQFLVKTQSYGNLQQPNNLQSDQIYLKSEVQIQEQDCHQIANETSIRFKDKPLVLNVNQKRSKLQLKPQNEDS